MSNRRSRRDQADAIGRIMDGVEDGAEVLKMRARSLSREAERAAEAIQALTNESHSFIAQFQTILLEEPLKLTFENINELRIIYMRTFFSTLSMLFGQKLGEYVIFRLFKQLIDKESSILLTYIIIPVLLVLRYFPTTNKNEIKEKLSERFLYIYSIIFGMVLGFVYILLQTDTIIPYGLLNTAIMYSYFNTPEFVLSINDKRKNQIIITCLAPLTMIIIGPILKDSFVIASVALLFYSCLNFISFQIYGFYNKNTIKGTTTAIILIYIISEIYIKTVLSLIH
uniref:Protein YIPF n=1 Tax=Parastrongyloides trichosuri TaxID=131310 RepID=A0A0N4ZZ25_PARTI